MLPKLGEFPMFTTAFFERARELHRLLPLHIHFGRDVEQSTTNQIEIPSESRLRIYTAAKTW